MTKPAKATLIATAVLAASATVWTGLQALLAAADGRASAAVVARVLVKNPDFDPPATGVAYWGSLVLLGTVQFVALASIALLLVAAGRRRSWAFLGAPLFLHPEPGNLVLSWLRPIGMGWQGPWVQDGIAVGQPFPSNVELFTPTAVGTVVDLLMIAAAAVVFLLLTRREPRRRVVPLADVVRRLALPLGLVAAATVGYGLVNPNGGDAERTIPLLVVPLAAALLATTGLGVSRAIAAVALAAFAASPGVGYLVAPALNASSSIEAWSAMFGYAGPLTLVAALGALIGAHGSAIAALYCRLVGRPTRALPASAQPA